MCQCGYYPLGNLSFRLRHSRCGIGRVGLAGVGSNQVTIDRLQQGGCHGMGEAHQIKGEVQLLYCIFYLFSSFSFGHSIRKRPGQSEGVTSP